MYLSKVFILLAIGLICINARCLKPKKVKILQRNPNCGCPLIETVSPCNCQKVVIDECLESYGVLNPDIARYGLIPAIAMPNVARCDCKMPVARCDVLPATNLPDLFEAVNLPGLAMPGLLADISCSCQTPVAFQYVENTCGCQTPALLEYLTIEMPAIADPCYVQTPKCQKLPLCGCGCQKMPCSCQTNPCSCQNMMCSCQTNPCGCQNMPCSCQTNPCSCQTVPCSCQNTMLCSCQSLPCSCQSVPYTCQGLPCSCQSMPCTCQSLPCSCQTMPCSCQSLPCSCQTMPCTCQSLPCSCQTMPCACKNVIPAVELPCGCQSCQFSGAELPVCGFSYQSVLPPVVGCGGKYLRQVTLQPPFL